MSFGVDPRNPIEYAGIRYFLMPCVNYSRAPISGVGGDYDFVLNTIWRVGNTPTGGPPTTGNIGDQWILVQKTGSYAQGNQNPTWIQLVGGLTDVTKFQVQNAAAPGTNPAEPDPTGTITVSGALVAAGTIPIQTITRALNAFNVEVQTSQAISATAANRVGLAAFSDAQFAVDGNGFVTLAGGSGPSILGIIPDAHTAPGTSPVVASGGNITMTGAQVAAGIIGANAIRINSLAANTLTVEIQQSATSSAKDTTKNGISHFKSSQFTCDEGFVSLNAPVSFSSYLSASVPNVTGDGSTFDIICDTATNNAGSAYDVLTGIFTAPTTNVYQFNATFCIDNIGAAHDSGRFILNIDDAASVPQQRVGISEFSPVNAASASAQAQYSGGCCVPMTAGWKCYLTLIVSGSTKTIGAKGGAAVSEPKCSFSGFRIFTD